MTVGVSGQLAYSYLQPRNPAAVSVAVQPTSPAPLAGAASVAPLPGVTPPETVPVPRRAAAAASLAAAPAATARPVSVMPAATAPILPESPSLSLPSPAALRAPALKPAALPPSRPPAATAIEPSSAEPSSAPVEPAEKPAASTTAKPAPPLDMPSSRDGAAEAIRQPAMRQQAMRLPESPDTAVAAPIPLLPSAGAAEAETVAAPVRPGPGSGGLY